MKRWLIRILLCAAVFMLMCSAASAQTITPLAFPHNHPVQTSSYARVLAYNEESNTLTVELICPEIFAYEDVLSLQAGDSIYTNGQEVLIETIESVAWDTRFINEGDESTSVSLVMAEDGLFRTKQYGDYIWTTLAVLECPVRDTLLFLDYIDHQTGNPLELPVVHTKEELTAHLLSEGAEEVFTAGLTCNNTYVTFDEEGNLATIHRYYVPWQ